jgi:ubiquitin C-terminal hydrolase
MQYKGLNNYGNMCYSNVIMQCMVSIEEFVLMLNSINDKIESEEDLFFSNKIKSENNDIPFRYPMLFNLVKTMNFYKSNFLFFCYKI